MGLNVCVCSFTAAPHHPFLPFTPHILCLFSLVIHKLPNLQRREKKRKTIQDNNNVNAGRIIAECFGEKNRKQEVVETEMQHKQLNNIKLKPFQNRVNFWLTYFSLNYYYRLLIKENSPRNVFTKDIPSPNAMYTFDRDFV